MSYKAIEHHQFSNKRKDMDAKNRMPQMLICFFAISEIKGMATNFSGHLVHLTVSIGILGDSKLKERFHKRFHKKANSKIKKINRMNSDKQKSALH